MNGDFLRKKIELSGFQLFEVAKNLGISQQNLQSKLKTSDVKVSFLEDLAKSINKNVYYFFEDSEETKCEENATILEGGKNGGKNGGKPKVKKMPPFDKLNELRDIAGGVLKKKKNLIPLYDDVQTIGGTLMSADMSPVTTPTDYIDAGDWFKDVTAAIRHYGDSMVEYPNGCILALRKLNSQRSIVWGRNYVVETKEIRVTKRLQTCPNDDSCIMAYSTNEETYKDGRLIHEPLKIYKEDIQQIFLVIGRVVKEYSSDPVYTLK